MAREGSGGAAPLGLDEQEGDQLTSGVGIYGGVLGPEKGETG